MFLTPPLLFKAFLISQPSPSLLLAANLPKLVAGLRLLSQSDPCVESFQQQTGEWVILTAGELHLEVCFMLLGNIKLRVQFPDENEVLVALPEGSETPVCQD